MGGDGDIEIEGIATFLFTVQSLLLCMGTVKFLFSSSALCQKTFFQKPCNKILIQVFILL